MHSILDVDNVRALCLHRKCTVIIEMGDEVPARHVTKVTTPKCDTCFSLVT
jgi:hypothetical protein